MSLFTESSLCLVPSGVKVGKVYSIKPTDGSGDLTFTRSNDTATRVGPDGLIEKVRTNQMTYSEDFTNVSYAKVNAAVSGNATTAPDGTLTADKMTSSVTATGFNYMQKLISVTGPVTISVYAKPAEITQFVFYASGSTNSGITFNLNGTFDSYFTGSANISGYSITPASNGFYRYSMSLIGSITDFQVYFSSGGTITLPTTIGDGMFLWGAQVETGDIATDYIATTSAAVSVGPVANLPRLDYLGSSCPRLLLEPQRTNLITYSEQFDNAAWTKTNTSVTANNTISPDGYANADKLVENTSNAQHGLRAVIASTINPFSFSVFAKSFSGNRYLQLRMANDISGSIVALFDLDNGTIVIDTTLYGGGYSVSPSKITSLGNGWHRCTISGNKTDNVGNNNIEINLSSTTTATEVYSYTGNGTSGAFIYGAQLEVGAYATSYIPTLGAAVTRGSDSALKTGIASLIGQSEGTIFVDLVYNGSESQTGNIFSFDETTLGSVVIVRNSNGSIGTAVWDGSAKAGFSGGSMPIGQRTKIAYAYKSGSTALFVNGVQIGSDNTDTFSLPTISQIYLNSSTAYFAFKQDASFNQALLFKTRLSNADLATLTA